MSIAARASLGLFGAILVGVFLYVLVTFVSAWSHMPKRGAHHTFGYALRESVLAVFVTLLFPLYVAFGQKRGRGERPVVLVHGYTQNRVDFVYISRFLRARGLGPIYGFNYFSFADIRASSKRLARFVERVCKDTGSANVDLVCHSMGGLVARACIALAPGRVRRCVTIASPHSGVRFRGPILGRGGRQLRAGTPFLAELETTPLGVPMLSIFSTHDNIVAPAPESASLTRLGGRDFIVDQVGHLAILFDKRVATATADFLTSEEKQKD
ncbi:MAG TPA: alpha/beta fold hydrolase [Polyangiaceae bacterium]|jgi:pimeloyl-ACP methyl ester carboxylesterase